MRILFITNRYPTDETPGDSPCIQEQELALRDLGHTVDVLVIPKGQSPLKYLRAMGQVFQAVQIRKQYDVIHAHYGYCGIVARAQFQSPVVVTFRGSDVYVPKEKWLGWLVARVVDQTIVMTEDMKRILGRRDIQVIPYGIDTALFAPQPREQARQGLGLAPTAPLVLFPYDPARRVKRYDLVRAAVDFLAPEFPEVQVLAMHAKSHAEVAAYMNASDVMVLASDSEGAPVAIREALACNLPVVSVDVGDVTEVTRGVTGCYIAERNPQDLAQKMAQVLRTRQRTDGRRVALTMSIAHSAAQIAAIYTQLVREHTHLPDVQVNKESL
jgi:teichuronic acid biosynthesis glycosyltransferase TuaC